MLQMFVPTARWYYVNILYKPKLNRSISMLIVFVWSPKETDIISGEWNSCFTSKFRNFQFGCCFSYFDIWWTSVYFFTLSNRRLAQTSRSPTQVPSLDWPVSLLRVRRAEWSTARRVSGRTQIGYRLAGQAMPSQLLTTTLHCKLQPIHSIMIPTFK